MWSKKYDKCIGCGTDKMKHAGNGLCATCASRKWRKENREKVNEQNKRYWAKHRQKLRKRMREYLKEYWKLRKPMV